MIVGAQDRVLERLPTLAGRSGIARIGLLRDYGVLISFLILFVALSLSSPVFFTRTNLLNILAQSAPIGIIACGATLVIIGGGFDLSAGAVFAVSGVVATMVARDVDPVLGFVLAPIVGAGFGLTNGGLVTLLRINPFVATLASGMMIRGLAVVLTGGFLILVEDPDFTVLGRGSVVGIRYSVFIFTAVILGAGFLLSRTVFGRYVYAVGGNAEAARLSGIRVGLIKSLTFMISGACAGLAGVISASRVSTGQADAGVGLELSAIAAVVIGGTSIMGGEGAIWRTVIGVLLIALIGNGFNILGIAPFYQNIVQGAIIVVAVAVDALARRKT
jgi:ribose transport system permease protein